MTTEYFPKITSEQTRKSKIEQLEKELFVREVPQEYFKLIDNICLVIAKSPYSDYLCEKLERDPNAYLPFLTEKIKDGTVLDLACGESWAVEDLVKELHSKMYIGVDLDPATSRPVYRGSVERKYEWSGPNDNIVINDGPRTLEQKQNNETVEIVRLIDDEKNGNRSIRVKSDMLKFISRLKDNSINAVIISAVEGRGITEINDQYLDALEKEIQRVLKEKGICIVYESEIGGLELNKIMEINILGNRKCRIYEKQVE